ncbi:hypothetical protein [Paenarthrobacter nicotinovorans]|uniref:hypothetical protein n=1 Tax=Paenarthrobacter nicotinovorans TaxID=29320 RepID=UPI00119DA539|nr:hypothetical protein [Paenarthrobacter nicotinovorans]
MIFELLETLAAIDPNEQAQRAADAAWESARWAFWMLLVTVGLLVGAFLAALYAKRTWEATNAQLSMARRMETEREASSVSAWLQDAKGSDPAVEVFVRNGNGGPVYDVECRILAKRANLTMPTDVVRTHSYVALGPEDMRATAVNYAFNMSPNEYVFSHKDPKDGVRYTRNKTTSVFFESDNEWKVWDGRPGTDGLAVDLTFRDSAGRSWRRDWHGQLAQIQGEES